VATDLVLRALQHLWTTLSPLHLPMAVMGGMAVSLWKHFRATQDIDILLGVPPEGEAALLETLERAGFRPRRQPPVMRLGDLRLLQLLYEPPQGFLEVQVDLLLASSEYHQQALERRVTTRIPLMGIDVSVLACEDLILHKLVAGRVLDQMDVGALLRANIATLDVPYLVAWSAKLGVRDDLAQLWGEAFPGDRLPA
jgi:hypothetical protein